MRKIIRVGPIEAGPFLRAFVIRLLLFSFISLATCLPFFFASLCPLCFALSILSLQDFSFASFLFLLFLVVFFVSFTLLFLLLISPFAFLTFTMSHHYAKVTQTTTKGLPIKASNKATDTYFTKSLTDFPICLSTPYQLSTTHLHPLHPTCSLIIIGCCL